MAQVAVRSAYLQKRRARDIAELTPGQCVKIEVYHKRPNPTIKWQKVYYRVYASNQNFPTPLSRSFTSKSLFESSFIECTQGDFYSTFVRDFQYKFPLLTEDIQAGIEGKSFYAQIRQKSAQK